MNKELLEIIVKELSNRNIDFNRILKSSCNTFINADSDKNGEISIEMKGSPIGLSILISFCIQAIIAKHDNIDIEKMIQWIRINYAVIEVQKNEKKMISINEPEMADVILELLKNPEKRDEIKKLLDEMGK